MTSFRQGLKVELTIRSPCALSCVPVFPDDGKNVAQAVTLPASIGRVAKQRYATPYPGLPRPYLC
jgi:hypothetical protein